MKYLLNSAVITAPGEYRYRLVTPDEARQFVDGGNWESTIGYQETADALGRITGRVIPVARRVIAMQAGDRALVFRLVLPPGGPRIDAAAKGQLTEEFVLAHCEMGLLERLA